ncbi:MAG: PilZ domain-containing protein [Rhodobiaceae bacterium]|nr:PilZ domain-containing protein [Rhodobiaceae bacterium]MCC0049763.1 PilZ domain-containing protein [Rhodobiaceae bacterium]
MKMKPEARKTVRHRALIRVKAVSLDRHRLVDCVIRNMSEAGAFLKCDAPESIPREGYLRFLDGKPDVQYQVRHGRFDGVGIAFLNPLPTHSGNKHAEPKEETPPLSFAEAAKQRLRERLGAKAG